MGASSGGGRTKGEMRIVMNSQLLSKANPDNASIECTTKGMFAVVAHDLQSTIAVGTEDECRNYLESARYSGAF